MLPLLILLPCSSIAATLHESQTMRREPAARSVQMNAHGDIKKASQKTRSKPSSSEKDSFCNFDYPLGNADTNDCAVSGMDHLITQESDCLDAADHRHGTVLTAGGTHFVLESEWETKHPIGCFTMQSGSTNLYFYNGHEYDAGEGPPGNITGTPVCYRNKYVEGSNTSGNIDGICPDEYEVVKDGDDDTRCQNVASCLSKTHGSPFKIGTNHANDHVDYPVGCLIKNSGNDAGKAFYNAPNTFGPGSADVKNGWPLCVVSVENPDSRPTPTPAPASPAAAS